MSAWATSHDRTCLSIWKAFSHLWEPLFRVYREQTRFPTATIAHCDELAFLVCFSDGHVKRARGLLVNVCL